jgi:hypothetical protein
MWEGREGRRSIIGVEDVGDEDNENAAVDLMIGGGCRRCDPTHARSSIGIP